MITQPTNFFLLLKHYGGLIVCVELFSKPLEHHFLLVPLLSIVIGLQRKEDFPSASKYQKTNLFKRHNWSILSGTRILLLLKIFEYLLFQRDVQLTTCWRICGACNRWRWRRFRRPWAGWWSLAASTCRPFSPAPSSWLWTQRRSQRAGGRWEPWSGRECVEKYSSSGGQ